MNKQENLRKMESIVSKLLIAQTSPDDISKEELVLITMDLIDLYKEELEESTKLLYRIYELENNNDKKIATDWEWE